MPRTKRKREAVVDPSPTARRRRSTAGHEPTKNEAEPIQNSNKSAPKTRAAAATAATPVPTVVSSNVKDAATTIMQSSSDNGKPSELSNKALQGKAIANAGAPSTEIGDEGNDHAETEEMKTSQTDKIEISQMGDETSDLRSSLPAQNSKNKNSKQTRRSSWMTDPTALDAAAAAVAVASNDFAENSRSREATIRRLLSHRKILLKGVRYGGNAARQRIEIIESKNPLQKTMTDEEETAAFQDMTRNVTSLVRKQGRQDNAMNAAADLTERRTSVSLRRGSSVGKRMNAALTSLTHHQGGLVLHGSENQTHPTNYVGVPAVQLLKSAQADTLMIVSGAQTRLDAGAVGTGLVGEAIGMVHPQAAQHFQTQHAAGPTVALNTMTTSSTAGAQKGARSASAAGLGAGPRKIQGAVTLGRGIVQKNVSMVAGQQQQQQVKAVSMMGGVTKIVLPQRPAHHQMEQPHFQPVMHVVCPETTALRERRDEIRIKLAKMLQDRHHRSELATCAIVENIPSKPHERRSSFSFIQSSLATRPSVSGQRTIPQSPRQLKQKRPRCILHLPLWQGPDPPPQLPRRRKTHWDTVLEEMRWMATDFIEERKWKHSTARMLGIQAVKAALNEQTVTFPALDNGTKPVFDMKSESETSVIFEIDSTKREPGGNRTGVEDDSLVTKDTDTDTDTRILECFHSVTVEDVVASRAAAKKASSMVAELVRANANTTARSFSQSNFEISDGRGRVTAYEEGRVSNVTDAQSPDSVSDSTPHFTMIADATTRAKGNALEVASNHVDLVLKTINDEKKSTAVDFQSSPETHGFHLSSRQSEVVKIIEDRWQRIQAGAVIRGPVASGKTIAACSLLWRNRSLGPQLLICSSASLVSAVVLNLLKVVYLVFPLT